MTNSTSLESVDKKSHAFYPIKFMHILFSILLVLIGAGIFLITILTTLQLAGYDTYLHYYLRKPVLLLVLGSIVLIAIGILGVITATINSYRGVVTFGVLVFGLFMFKLTLGAVAYFTKSAADLTIYTELEKHVADYDTYYTSIDYVQSNLNCCGVYNFTDWNDTLGYVPGSCCGSESACGFSDITSLNLTGCYEALLELITYCANWFLIILGALVTVEVTSMMFSFFLGLSLAKSNHRSGESTEPPAAMSPVSSIPRLHDPLSQRRSSTSNNSYNDNRSTSNNSYSDNRSTSSYSYKDNRSTSNNSYNDNRSTRNNSYNNNRSTRNNSYNNNRSTRNNSYNGNRSTSNNSYNDNRSTSSNAFIEFQSNSNNVHPMNVNPIREHQHGFNNGNSMKMNSLVDLPRNSERQSYVRHPVQKDIVLDYKSPHESFLSAPPQLRFDRSYARLK